MDTQVIPDISDVDATTSATPSRPEDVAPTVRRFQVDPASSPMLLAALAWDTAGPRRR